MNQELKSFLKMPKKVGVGGSVGGGGGGMDVNQEFKLF